MQLHQRANIALAATLLLALAAALLVTLGANAQTDQIDGRIIARIQDRTNDNGADDYRIEFGFLPAWTMADSEPWSAAVAEHANLLPSSRYLTKARIDQRANDDHRGWLRSSLITLPPQADAPADSSLSGRVIARYSPHPRTGALRIEFGFLPQWTFDRAGGTQAAVEQYGDQFLPAARYISAQTIAERRGVWLRSSLVSVTAPPQPPAIDAISCAPAAPQVNETVVCQAEVSGGEPDSWSWSGGPATGSGSTYSTSFALPGLYTISLTLSNNAGSDTASADLNVALQVVETTEPPAIDGITCTPSAPTANESVTCEANLSGGAPESWSWSGGATDGRDATYTTSFSTAGEQTVSLTVRNEAGSAAASLALQVAEELQPPTIDGIICEPSAPRVNAGVICEANLSGGAVASWTWNTPSSNTADGYSRWGTAATFTIAWRAAGEQRVTLTVANDAGEAADSTTVQVVQPADSPPIINRITCAPSPVEVGRDLTCTAALSGGAPDTYDWSGGSGTNDSGATFSTSFSAAGRNSVWLTVRNAHGQAEDVVFIEVIEPVLEPPLVIAVVCSPFNVTVDQRVTCSVQFSGGAPDSYEWSAPGSANGSSATYTPSSATTGRKTVSLTVRNAHGDSSGSGLFFVLDPPEITRISCAPSHIEPGGGVSCEINIIGTPPFTYAWSGGDTRDARRASTRRNRTYSPGFSRPGSHTVSVTVTNPVGSDTASVSVEAVEPSSGPLSVDSVTCTPSSIGVDQSVNCTAVVSGGEPDSYKWTGGDSPGTDASYSPSFGTSGDKTVWLTVKNDAGAANGSTTVTVLDPPQLRDITCAPSRTLPVRAVRCTVFGTGGTPPFTYAWSGGDAAGSSSIYEPSWSGPGDKTVSVTVSNSVGSASESTAVEVGDFPPPVQPTIGTGGVTCTPSSTQTGQSVTCTVNLSAGTPPLTYDWYGGDQRGSDATYTPTFSIRGANQVYVTVSNSLGSVRAQDDVEVSGPDSGAIFIQYISCDQTRDIPLNTSIACNGVLHGGVPDSYAWSGGDSSGSGATYNPSFSTSGPKIVRLTVTNASGSVSQSTELTVLAAPTIQLPAGCMHRTLPTGGSTSCWVTVRSTQLSYAWSGGDIASTSRTYDPSFSTAGDYTVSITASNPSGSVTSSTAVTVIDPPQVSGVSCDASQVEAGGSVSCTAVVSGGGTLSYAWSGGDSAGSSATYAPSFSTAGAKTVSLTVTNAVGSDSDSTTVTVAATAPQISSISCTPSPVAVNSSVSCTASLSGGAPDSYAWTATGVLGDSSPTYAPSFGATGEQTISLTVRNSAGSASASTTVNVIEPPTISSISCDPSTTAAGASVSCTAVVSGGGTLTYAWSGGDSNGSAATYAPSWSETGAKTVSLTVSNAVGSDSDSTPVTVAAPATNPAPG